MTAIPPVIPSLGLNALRAISSPLKQRDWETQNWNNIDMSV